MRPTLYFLAAAFPAGMSFVAQMPEEPTAKQWVLLAFALLTPGIVALKAFYDKTVANSAAAKPGPLLMLALSAGVAVTCLAGCKLTPQAQAYVTLKNTKSVVLNAMDVYADAVARGEVSEHSQQVVDKAYTDWSKAFQAAVRVARFNYSEATPDNVQTLALGLVALIDDL